ncbi:hypothetical protein VHEMI02132 [[Torrubiella] hemipterigena]|uniref:Peptidase S1 domain-containing protein n=1 Tax=[Torrubiella] hemipterigena TaxID=1531966 RepID=A0A0A1T791_9HYPO|nr:hypothetical protein VHEMI02132 [[Torrubiella] hemipterigena]
MSIKVGSSLFDDGEVHNVTSFFLHPKFVNLVKGDIPDYDVSILKLATPLSFGPGIQPVGGMVNKGQEPVAGDIGFTSGWGTLQWQGESPKVLQSVEIPVIRHEVCARTYAADKYRLPVGQRMFCASMSQGGEDSCNSDSGGPFIINKKIAGIVSWGHECPC